MSNEHWTKKYEQYVYNSTVDEKQIKWIVKRDKVRVSKRATNTLKKALEHLILNI